VAGEVQRQRFEAERAYLRELGREFSERYPELGSMLSDEHSDPSVERLLQGVAFLTARIQARLDDDLPELGQRILRQLCPQLLRPVPSLVIQQFNAAPQATAWQRVPKRTWVAQPRPATGGAPPECRFQTLWDVDLPPWQISDVGLRAVPGGSLLRLELKSLTGAAVERTAPPSGQPLRLHLHGEDRAPQELLYFLRRHLSTGPRLVATVGNTGASEAIALPAPELVGFGSNDALLPGWGAAPDGWRVLFEGMMFPEKFLFIDLHGLEILGALQSAASFVIEFPFNKVFPNELHVSKDLFRLGCTPAVNLFEHSAAPLQRLPLRAEYRVLAEASEARQMEVFSIEKVTGVSTARPKAEYRPFTGVAQAGWRSGSCWYDVQMRETTVPGHPRESTLDPWMSLSLPNNPSELMQNERISLDLVCCNAFWPHLLRAGDLSVARSGLPKGVTTHNLRRPTRRVLPALGEHLAWRTVSALGLGRQELNSPESLRRLLDLLNLRAVGHAEDEAQHVRRSRAIEKLELAPEERMVSIGSLSRPATADRRASSHARMPMRGLRVTLQLDYEGLGGVGGCHMFGLLLDHFLSSMTGITSFTAVSLRDVGGRGPPIDFAPRLGSRVLT
jgi:type VI secretion system protein ImpG